MKVWLVQLFEPCHVEVASSSFVRIGHIADDLSDAGHNVVWWLSSYSHIRKKIRHEVGDVDVKQNLKLRFLPSFRYRTHISVARLFHHRISALAVRRILQGEIDKPDLILCCNFPLEVAEEFSRYAQANRIPVIIDVQDLWPDSFPFVAPPLLRPLAHLLYLQQSNVAKNVLRNATALTSVSETYLDWAVGKYSGRNRTEFDKVFPLVAVSDVRSDRDHAIVRSSYGCNPETLLVVFAGTLGITYDIETICACFEKLHETHPDIKLVIAGDGNKRTIVEEAAKRQILTYVGWLDKDRLNDLLSAADIGLCAYSERATQSLPCKPFDYMMNGLAIINSLRGELEALIKRERCGIQYLAGNPDSLRNAIEKLHGDKAQLELLKQQSHLAGVRDFNGNVVFKNFREHISKVARVQRRPIQPVQRGKILYIHQYYTDRTGRGGTRSYEFSKRLVENGWSIEMICGSFDLGKIDWTTVHNGKAESIGFVGGVRVEQLKLGYTNYDRSASRPTSGPRRSMNSRPA